MFRSIFDHPQGDIFFYATTNQIILSLVTEVKKKKSP